MKTYLFLVAHPDDEVLSFGGIIQRAIKLGHKVHIRFYCVGGPSSNATQDTRLSEMKDALKVLGVDATDNDNVSIFRYGLDGLLSTLPNSEITTDIDKVIEYYKPEEVYCSARSEHSDHIALYNAFLGACRLKSGHMPNLIAVGTYQFSDQLITPKEGGKIFMPLTKEEFKLKLKAFEQYKTQLRPSPSPLGVDGLEAFSRYQGLLCGAPYAELYYQLRYIHKM